MNSAIIIIDRLSEVYIILIFIRVVMSWFRVNPSSFFVRAVMQATQPVFDLVRRIFPKTVWGMIDFSPIIAFFMIDTLRYIIILILTSYF